ncbi:unnamed protein product [Protopolystoma xenopodis]|uniref:Uncharacterized protein n=1 Tax=Protopolystoma xenopodis TaxID=117903 RepID=A0A448X3L9_9PLAT|nr:unnamed protein product [Protopolystoma xenopodis]
MCTTAPTGRPLLPTRRQCVNARALSLSLSLLSDSACRREPLSMVPLARFRSRRRDSTSARPLPAASHLPADPSPFRPRARLTFGRYSHAARHLSPSRQLGCHVRIGNGPSGHVRLPLRLPVVLLVRGGQESETAIDTTSAATSRCQEGILGLGTFSNSRPVRQSVETPATHFGDFWLTSIGSGSTGHQEIAMTIVQVDSPDDTCTCWPLDVQCD